MTEATTTTSGAESVDLSGRVLGDYRILRRLGRGAMAEVYLAEQLSLRRQVAFKVLLSHLSVDASSIERFRLEAQAAAALVHANIVQVYEVGRIDGLHYIVQEYVPGCNLKEYIARHGALDARQAVRLMRQVASALHKAATHGIVHRDIKPENIMLSTSGEVKVADFGLARMLTDSTLNLTQIGVTLGTPLYMSPEQVEGRPLDPRSDLYSFGVTCYHMLAGRPPFESETALGVAVQHLKAEPPPLEGVRPDLPPALCAIVMRLLAKDPNQRMANARELLRALARLGMTEGDEEETWSSVAADAKTDFSLQAATQRLQTALLRQETIAARSGTRRKLMVAAAATAAAIAAGALLAWWTHEPFALAGADGTRTHVEKQATAMEQHLYASTLNTEEGWLSVREYFPNEPFYIRLADQQLARLYLHQGDYARARRIFQQFADMDESEESFRAFGLAGLCVVNSFEDHPQQSAEALNQLFGLRRHLDPQMRQLVQLAVQRNREKFNPREVQAWQEWFERQAAEEVQRAE